VIVFKIALVHMQAILDRKKDGEKLTTVECHDIICHLADAVLSGGIRRAAMISLFDADDMDMISCKSGNWWELNSQRGRANNSAVLLRNKITQEFFMDLWKRIENSKAGEPGIFFTNDKDWGTNPCCFTGDTKIDIVDPKHSNRIKTTDFYSLIKMKEDGIHENFWSMPEMPWKRKEREMDNEFKKLVLRYLALIVMLLWFGKETIHPCGIR
jgi:hypothetical protein